LTPALINKINYLEYVNHTFESFNQAIVRKYLVVIVGPTAVGKTTASVELAKYFNCAILNADSRQVFRELNIGTAKPTIAEMQGVHHYFVNDRNVKEEYSAGQFEKEALKILKKEFAANNYAICAGGSGLYVDALCYGLNEFPEPDMEIRKSLNGAFLESGISPLQAQLLSLDPDYAKQVDLDNPQRVIRALEICLSADRPFSELRTGALADRDFEIIFVGLELSREELYERINGRMDEMIGAGLFEEVQSLLKLRQHNALQTIGYKEVFDFLDGRFDKMEAIRLLKRNSRRFAKRQMTWFKKNQRIKWFAPNQIDQIISYIESK